MAAATDVRDKREVKRMTGGFLLLLFFGQTCFEPAVVGERLPGLQRFVPVLLEDGRPSNQELALSPRETGSHLRRSDTHKENQVETRGCMDLSATSQFQRDGARATECDAIVPRRTG